MSMSEYSKRRLETAIVKANQLKETGAEIVATACHNCVDGLTDLIKHYKLKMKVSLVGELVANALVYDKMYIAPEHKIEPLAQHQVLVIDDDPDVILFLTTLLEDNGYRTLSAESNETALKVLEDNKPDLITLDLIMPGKSGLTFYHTLRTNDKLKDIPVVIVSGVNPENPGQYDTRSFIYQHSLPRPEGYIEKPVNRELLLMTIEKIINLKVSKR